MRARGWRAVTRASGCGAHRAPGRPPRMQAPPAWPTPGCGPCRRAPRRPSRLRRSPAGKRWAATCFPCYPPPARRVAGRTAWRAPLVRLAVRRSFGAARCGTMLTQTQTQMPTATGPRPGACGRSQHWRPRQPFGRGGGVSGTGWRCVCAPPRYHCPPAGTVGRSQPPPPDCGPPDGLVCRLPRAPPSPAGCLQSRGGGGGGVVARRVAASPSRSASRSQAPPGANSDMIVAHRDRVPRLGDQCCPRAHKGATRTRRSDHAFGGFRDLATAASGQRQRL
jgi:hypothetical protein